METFQSFRFSPGVSRVFREQRDRNPLRFSMEIEGTLPAKIARQGTAYFRYVLSKTLIAECADKEWDGEISGEISGSLEEVDQISRGKLKEAASHGRVHRNVADVESTPVLKGRPSSHNALKRKTSQPLRRNRNSLMSDCLLLESSKTREANMSRSSKVYSVSSWP